MKLLNIANKVVKGNFADLIATNNNFEITQSPISKAIKKKKEQLPQFDYLFIVKMPDLTVGSDNVGVLNNNNTMQDKNFDVDLDINHRVFSISVPNFSYDTVKTQTKNTYWYSASNKDLGQISMTVDEFEDGLSLKYIQAWFSLIENTDGTYNVPAYYKRDIQVVRYSGSKNELSTLTYKGCFPTGISESSYSHESSGILQYNVTFACDTMTFDVSPNVKAAIAQVQSQIIKDLPSYSAGANLNTESAINILGRIADIII